VVAQFSKYREFLVEVRVNGQIVRFGNFNYEMRKREECKEWGSMKSGQTGFKIVLKGIFTRGEGRRSNCMYRNFLLQNA